MYYDACMLQVPLELAVRETSDAGAPIVASQPDSASARVYRNIAQRVAQQLASAAGGQQGPKITIE
jgi:ATP-binding protein involved in chromosome partitioning